MPTYFGTNTTYTLESGGVASVVYSADQTLIYVARRDGHIDVFDRATHSLVTSWTVGTALAALSLSEDGTFLLAVEDSNNTTGVLHRVSTATGAVQDYTSPNGRFFDVEIVNAHTAILSGGQMRKLDLDTGIFTTLLNATYYSSSQIVLVEDQHLTLLAEPGISNGPLAIYDDRTGTITARGDNYQSGVTSGFNFGHQAISEAAGQVAQFSYYGSLNLYDLSLHAIGTVSVGGRVDGLAYDPTGTYLYVYQIDSGMLAKYSVANFQLVDQIPVGTSQWHNHIGSGDQIHISSDGRYVTLSDTATPPYSSGGGKLQLIDLSARDEYFGGTTGADTFYGRDGNDVYFVDNVGDVVVETAANGIDTVSTTLASYALTANVEILAFVGSGAFAGTGNVLNNTINASGASGAAQLSGAGGNDRLYGGIGNDRLDGGTGQDLMVGGAGDDVYVVDTGGDQVFENANEGTDTIESPFTFDLASVANVENITLTGNAAIDATGDVGNNVLRGNGGTNYLYGGGGTDTFFGGAGDDVYIVDSADDVVIEYANEGTDLIKSSSSYTLAEGSNVESLRLSGTGNIDAAGNWDVNKLVGNTGDNILDGGGGGDVLRGGLGNDTYIIRDATDRIIEIAGNGTNDTVRAAVSYALEGDAWVERLQTIADAAATAIDLVGNSHTTSLRGNAGANHLTGGTGDEALYGLGGADVFVFAAGGVGHDIVGDFVSGTDKLDLTAYFVDFASVQAATHDVGGSAVISLGGGQTVTLSGVTSAQLQSGDVYTQSNGGGAAPETRQLGSGDAALLKFDLLHDYLFAGHFAIDATPMLMPMV